MGTKNLFINYRPVKIGFLVREGHVEDLVKAAGINTLLWGGVYNPVIPVNESGNFADELINLFSVDVLYAVEHSGEINTLLEKNAFLRSPSFYNRKIILEGWRGKNSSIGYLDTINLIDRYWEKEFKNAPEKEKSNCCLIRWDDKDDLKDVFSVLFGYFPLELGLEYNYEEAFVTGLNSKIILINNEKPLDGDIANIICPVHFTGLDLKGYGGTYFGDGVYISKNCDFHDLVDFWNLRASGLDVSFLPLNKIDRFTDYIKTNLDKIDRIPTRNREIEGYISFYFRELEDSVLEEIKGIFPTRKKAMNSKNDKIIWNGLNIKPTEYYFERGQSIANVDLSYNHYVVTVDLKEKKFLSDSKRNVGFQNIVVTVNSLGDYEHPRHTLELPYIRILNEFYSREITFDPWIIRIEKDGIGAIVKSDDNMLQLRPISFQSLIERIFYIAGMKVGLNQPGRIAMRILEKIEGVDGGRVFKIRGVRELFKKLSQRITKKIIRIENEKEIVEQIITTYYSRKEAEKIIRGGAEFKKYENLFIEPRQKPTLEPSDVFDFLLKCEFLMPGLELTCEHCKLKEWLPLRAIDDIGNCSYCGYGNKTCMHLKLSSNAKGEGDWKFRKSGLFEKDNNQEGAIPVILTLLVFNRIFETSNFIYSTALDIVSDTQEFEIDYCVLNYHHNGRIEIGIGECKDQGGEISDNNIKNLIKARELFLKKHINCILIFSKTADAFNSNEMSRFRALLDDNVPFILLTNKELEPYHPYMDSECEEVKSMHAFNLEEMYRNTIKIYFGRKAKRM